MREYVISNGGMNVGRSESAEFSMNSLRRAGFPSFCKRFSYDT